MMKIFPTLALPLLLLMLLSSCRKHSTDAELSGLKIEGSSGATFDASIEKIGNRLKNENPALFTEFTEALVVTAFGAGFAEDDPHAAMAAAHDGLTVRDVIEKAAAMSAKK